MIRALSLAKPHNYSFKFVKPDDSNWKVYLSMCFKYLHESWPHDYIDESSIPKYEKELKQRFHPANRFFLLLHNTGKIVGLANLFLHKNALHVAEYYILPEERRHKNGYNSFLNIIDWARGFTNTIKIEVDKDLDRANKFWQSFDGTLDSSGDRNIYTLVISAANSFCTIL